MAVILLHAGDAGGGGLEHERLIPLPFVERSKCRTKTVTNGLDGDAWPHTREGPEQRPPRLGNAPMHHCGHEDVGHRTWLDASESLAGHADDVENVAAQAK